MADELFKDTVQKADAPQKSSDYASARFAEEAQSAEPIFSPAFAVIKHRSITQEAMSHVGVRGATAMGELTGGNVAQDVDLSTRNDPAHHFDSNRIPEALSYLEQNNKEIDQMLLKPALSLDDEAQILNVLGHRLHTIQDFYAHSNYVEMQLKANPKLMPDQIPLMNFDDLKEGKEKNIHTGYVVRDETTRLTLKRPDVIHEVLAHGEKLPGTHYMGSARYAGLKSFQARLDYFTDPNYSFLHRDINKDDHHSDEGKLVNPRTGITLHDYARNLALRETERDWAQFESRVKELRGDEYGSEIIYQMKTMNYDRRPDNNNFVVE